MAKFIGGIALGALVTAVGVAVWIILSFRVM